MLGKEQEQEEMGVPGQTRGTANKAEGADADQKQNFIRIIDTAIENDTYKKCSIQYG